MSWEEAAEAAVHTTVRIIRAVILIPVVLIADHPADRPVHHTIRQVRPTVHQVLRTVLPVPRIHVIQEVPDVQGVLSVREVPVAPSLEAASGSFCFLSWSFSGLDQRS